MKSLVQSNFRTVVRIFLMMLVFILIQIKTYAQNFEWLLTPTGSNQNDVGVSVVNDNHGYVYSTGSFTGSLSVPNIGQPIISRTTNFPDIYLVKSNSISGLSHVCKSVGGNRSDQPFDLAFDNISNSIYLCGRFQDTSYFENDSIFTLTNLNDNGFIAKYDSSCNLKWVKKFPGQFVKSIAIDKYGYIYAIASFSNSISFNTINGQQNYISNGGQDFYISKIDTNGLILWLKVFGGTGNDIINDISIDGSNNLILYGQFELSIQLDTLSLNSTGAGDILIAKLDSSGKCVNAVKVGSPATESGRSISALNAGGFFCTGILNNNVNSLNFGSNIILNGFGASGSSMFVAYYDSLMRCKWAKRVGGTTSAFQPTSIANYNGSFAIITGHFTGLSRFDNIQISTSSTSSDIFICKVDSLSNFAWAFRAGGTSVDAANSVFVDSVGDSYITGFFNGNIILGNKSSTSTFNQDFFLTKISDIGISRTPLTKTVYCAGDSVQVPYTKYNTFHAANRFYAQLSDTAGRFDNPVTIGSRLSNQNGTIACRLPLNLPYSTKYQLRVVSDSPVVQSYYLNQTYTIFPRPVATANHLTLCSGQADTLMAINLNNNTAQWSPATYLTHINDSSVRFTAPANTTASAQLDFVKLLVSNAGGCKDSTMLNVTIRPKLHVQVSSDTTLCTGQTGQSPTITLRATSTGGDSSNYRYLWKDATGKVWSSWSPQDTLPAHTDSTRTYTVYVTDGCTLLPDTAGSAQVTVTIRPPLQLSILPDTLVCKGSAVTLTALPSGGKGTGNYTIQWFILPDTTSVQHTGNTYTLTVNNNQQYHAKLTDGCTAIPAWSNSITVNTYNNIQLTPRTDTTINKGQSVNLTAQATQGKGSGYTLTWYKLPDSTTAIGTTNLQTALPVQPDSTTTYRVIATDGCAANTDTAQVEITVRQQLKISIAGSNISNHTHDTIMCTGQSITYSLQANYPSAGQQFTWNQGQGTGSTKTLSPATTTTYRVILSDNQSTPDTVYLTITVRPPLQLHNLHDTTVCEGQSVTFNPFVTGGNNTPPNGYQFLWDDNTTTASKTFTVSTTTITSTLTVSDNCSTPQSKSITITPELNPNINLTAMPTQGCPPLNTTLTNTQNNSGTYTQEWDFGNGQRSQTTTTNNSNNSIGYTYTQQGSYTPTLKLSSARGCKATATLAGSINVATPPVAAFRLSMDTTWITLPKIKITNQSQQADSFFWHFSRLINDTVTTSTSPSTFERHFTDSGLYLIHLKAQSNNGCSDSMTKPLVVLMDYDVWIPTAFSPGAKDNLNPTFGPVGVGIDRYRMIIYNRWGQIVFSSKGERDTWNGGLNNNPDEPLPDGVYVWYLEIYNYHNKGTIKGGTVQIVR